MMGWATRGLVRNASVTIPHGAKKLINRSAVGSDGKQLLPRLGPRLVMGFL
jgi:hypothetical protein